MHVCCGWVGLGVVFWCVDGVFGVRIVLCCVVSCFVPLYLLKSLPRGNQVDGLPRATSFGQV